MKRFNVHPLPGEYDVYVTPTRSPIINTYSCYHISCLLPLRDQREGMQGHWMLSIHHDDVQLRSQVRGEAFCTRSSLPEFGYNRHCTLHDWAGNMGLNSCCHRVTKRTKHTNSLCHMSLYILLYLTQRTIDNETTMKRRPVYS